VLSWGRLAMLTGRSVLDSGPIAIQDFACRHPAGTSDAVELTTRHTLVFVRRGCFVRSTQEVTSLLDPTLAYFTSPGEEERFTHPHAGGDDCTAIALDTALAASLWGGEPTLPSGPLRVPPRLDLAHRLLLAAGNRSGDPHELSEQGIGLAAAALERLDRRRVAAGRPSTARLRRALADGARELLAEEPGRSLPELARTLAVSPHHLSRIFRTVTGHTISRHRMHLRTRAALERLAGGERNLARLAADVGFADQSHLCRVLRAETGALPSVLREAIGASTKRARGAVRAVP
jgi:AraC-like DNA-binding protein